MGVEAIAYLRKREDELRRKIHDLNREHDAIGHAIMMIERASIEVEEIPDLVREVTTQEHLGASLNASHVKVLGQLREVAKDGIAEMPLNTLTRSCNIGRDAAKQRLQDLQDAGYILQIRAGWGAAASRYQLLKKGFPAASQRGRAQG